MATVDRMKSRVFQVDHTAYLTPYSYEIERLSSADIELVEGFCETPYDVITRGADADVLWLSWKPSIDRYVLESLPRCRLVVRWGIGYEQVDLEAATQLGVAVANAPTYGTDDVAEHALALLFALERRLVILDADMKRGGWARPEPGTIRRIKGRTLGLVGVGRIGEAMARRAAALGLEVIGHDASRSPSELSAIGVDMVGLDELAIRSDYVSIHVPHTAETEGMVDARFLAKMKSSSFLINTSRGKVVRELDLIAALSSGSIAGAGLDVFWDEPLVEESPLRRFNNVILTPHYAGYSIQAWADLREEMCRTTIDFLSSGWAETIVNPEVKKRMRPVHTHS